jgi:predicted component of type VI protein secretion system
VILEIKRGQAKNLKRTITEPVFLVGNSEDCDLVLGDQQFPAIHFYILYRQGRTILRPTSSFPELTLNGRLQNSAGSVSPGDRIRTGPYEFVVKAA